MFLAWQKTADKKTLPADERKLLANIRRQLLLVCQLCSDVLKELFKE
jgi:hypothetical protein